MISIIVTVYNDEKLLSRCLDSLLNQSFEDLEIILIDDGSKDGSSRICEEYTARNPRIRAFHQNNAGQSAARNHGLSLACGDFIGFVDSDDYVDREMFEKLHGILTREAADIAVCNYMKIMRSARQMYDHGFGNCVLEHPDIVTRYINTFYTGQAVGFNSACNKLYRASLLLENSLRFNDFRKRGDDGFFNLLVIYHARKIAFTPEALYNYINNPASITHSFERGRLVNSEFNVKEILEMNERYFHLTINLDAFYRGIIMNAVVMMSDAFLLKRADKYKIVREFYDSSFFRDMIAHEGQLGILPKLLCRAILKRNLALATILVRLIAVLRRTRRLARDGWATLRMRQDSLERSDVA